MPDLERYLQEFDGVAVSKLSDARYASREDPGYVGDLVRLCRDPRPKVSSGATWILKAECDEGAKFEAEQLDPLISSLDKLPSWQAKLHVCQSIEAFELTPSQVDTVFEWAASLADHGRPFLRGWSLHAMVILSLRFHHLQDEAKAALSVADSDGAASVRARARKLRELHAPAKTAEGQA